MAKVTAECARSFGVSPKEGIDRASSLRMLRPPISRAELPRRCARPGRLSSYLLLSALGLGSGACELVLGEIPDDDWQPPDIQVRPDAASADGGADDLDASPADASVPDELFDASGDGDGDGDDLDANMEPDEAGPVIEDSSVTPPRDSGTPGKPDSGVPTDAGQGDGAVPCTPVTWYADDDGDGEGNSAKTTKACLKPAGKWVDHGGDCSDADARAKHGQTTYYGTPYKNAAGQDSFDFDCSGQEEPWAGQPLAAATCNQLDCKGTGYAKTARTGTGVYAYCGSLTQTTCKLSLLICSPSNAVTTEPFLCR